MHTTTKATKDALSTLKAIYDLAMRPPRYNDHKTPTSSLTGTWELHTNDKNAFVERNQNEST